MIVTLSDRWGQRGGTAANLTAVNEVPLVREMIIETDTGKFKFGDGITNWNSLPYNPWIASAFARANHTGTQALSTLSQSGASVGQVATWNGTAWVPQAGGGGGAALTKSYTESAGHSFVVGNLVYKSASVWALADRDAAASVADGIVIATDAGTGGDPYWANVTSLLYFTGADATTVMTDSKGITWTANGNAQIDTAIKKFGTGALLLDGTGDYLSASNTGFNFGSGDFTVEGFFYSGITPTDDGLFGTHLSSNASGFSLSVNALTYQIERDGAYANVSQTWVPSVWHWFVFQRTAGVLAVYIDGTRIYNAATTTNISTSTFYVGAYYSTGYPFQGSLDGYRVTKGVARYSGTTITVPTADYPATGPAHLDFTLQYAGPLTLTAAEWDAVIESPPGGGLVPGTRYYAASTPGKIAGAPGSGIAQPVLRAISVTEALVLIGDGNAGGGGGGSTLVGSATVTGSAATSVTVSGLSLSAAGKYRVVIRSKAAASGQMRIFFNGDTTATNYWTQQIYGQTTSGGYRVNLSEMFYNYNGYTSTAFAELTLDIDGAARMILHALCNQPSGTTTIFSCLYYVTVADVTSITVTCATAGGLAVGTTIEIWSW